MENSETPHTSSAPANRGQFVVIAMFAVALAAATFAWWWNYHRGDQALAFFGAEGARLIRTAPKVEYLRSLDEPLDISRAPGLLNARTSLLSDASYEWSAPDLKLESPLFSVRFSRGRSHVVVTFDFENRTIKSSTTGRTATLIKKTADGWQAYLARQVSPAEPVKPPEPARTGLLE